MKSWFNHIYLTNLYDALQPVQHTQGFKAPLKEVRIDSKPLDMHDRGVQRFFSVIGFKPDEKDVSLRSIKSALFQWVLVHSWGPGSYDSTSVDDLFDLRTVDGGFSELDRLFYHMAQVTLTGIIQDTEILHAPADPGLHGGACYRCHLDVLAFDLPSMYGRRGSMAMGSSLGHLIPLVIQEVAAQSDRYNRLNNLGIDSPEYQAESKTKRAKPTKIYVELNGVDVLSAEIPNKNKGEVYEIDWNTVVHGGELETIRSLSAALPKHIGRRVKSKFLENELGM